MKNTIIIFLLIILSSCSKDDLKDDATNCYCTKIYFNSIGQVSNTYQVIVDDCLSVGSFPDDLQNNGGSNYIINCNN